MEITQCDVKRTHLSGGNSEEASGRVILEDGDSDRGHAAQHCIPADTDQLHVKALIDTRQCCMYTQAHSVLLSMQNSPRPISN